MRIAMLVAAIALVSSPSLASPSCMTQNEARAKFPTAHLWWHGPNRCWDATPSRTQLSKRIKARETRAASPEVLPEREAPQEKLQERLALGRVTPEKRPANWAHESRWREAMSRMLPEDEPRVEAAAQAQASSTREAPLAAPVAPQMNWHDRWIEVSPAAKRAAGQSTPADVAANAEPIVTPTRVMLALLAVVLTLGFVELVFRKTVPEWRR